MEVKGRVKFSLTDNKVSIDGTDKPDFLQEKLKPEQFGVDTSGPEPKIYIKPDVVKPAPHQHTKADITDFNESDYVHRTGDENIEGNKTFTGDVTIQGKLITTGSPVEIESEVVRVKDNIITLNDGEPGSGVSTGKAGIEIDRGSEPKAQFLFDESDDKWKIGFEGGTFEVIAFQSWVNAQLGSLTLSGLSDVDDSDKGPDKVLKWDDSLGKHVYVTIADISTYQIKTSNADTTPGYLIEKVKAGDGINITEVEESGVKKAEFSARVDNVSVEIKSGEISVKDGGINVDKLANNIDASGKGFNADKLDGKDATDFTPIELVKWNAVDKGYALFLAQETGLLNYTIAPATSVSGADVAGDTVILAPGSSIEYEIEVSIDGSTPPNKVALGVVPDATGIKIEWKDGTSYNEVNNEEPFDYNQTTITVRLTNQTSSNTIYVHGIVAVYD